MVVILSLQACNCTLFVYKSEEVEKRGAYVCTMLGNGSERPTVPKIIALSYQQFFLALYAWLYLDTQ